MDIRSLQQRGNQYHSQKVFELLCQVRTINCTNAKKLLKKYGCLKDIILCGNYDNFGLIEGIAKVKVDALNYCFKGKFCK